MAPRLRDVLLLQPHAGYPLMPDTHDFHEMVVVVRGTYHSHSRGEHHALTVGDAIFYPAGTPHKVLEHIGPTFFCIQWSDHEAEHGKQAIVVNDPTQRLTMAARWLHDIHTRADKDHVAESGVLKALIREVFVLTTTQSPEDIGNDSLESVRRVLITDFGKQHSIPCLAAMAGLGERHLTRQFRRRFGCSPSAYLRQLRIEAALTRLTNRQGSNEEIAQDCGFGRSSYMSRVLRAHTGLTPTQIRQGERSPLQS